MKKTLGMLVAVFLAVGCGGSSEPAARMHDDQMNDMGPPRLVVGGSYSDERFIDMMAPHHQMAIDMAQHALEHAQHEELRELARSIIEEQQREIDELKALKQRVFGSADVPMNMHPDEMANSGTMPMEELAAAPDFDKAFIDGMLPHHAGAIEMASVARMRSNLPEIRSMARSIIDSQAREVGQLAEWRQAWYGTEP